MINSLNRKCLYAVKLPWLQLTRPAVTKGHLNEWCMMMISEWCTYIALYCVLLYTQSALQSGGVGGEWGGGGVSPQPPPVCSIHLDDATAATGQQRQCAHHTPATGGEERESLSQSSDQAQPCLASVGNQSWAIHLKCIAYSIYVSNSLWWCYLLLLFIVEDDTQQLLNKKITKM